MFQRVELIGNLGQNPELNHTQNQNPVCNLSVATAKSWRDSNTKEKKSKTEWHRVIVWGLQAENAVKYLKKGSKVFIEGELETREWEKDGIKRYTTEVVAKNVQYLDSKDTTNQAPRSYAGDGQNMNPSNVSQSNQADLEVPF